MVRSPQFDAVPQDCSPLFSDSEIARYAKLRGRRESVSAEALDPLGADELTAKFSRLKLKPGHKSVTGEELAALCKVLAGHVLFSHLDSKQLRIIADLFHVETKAKNEIVITQGDNDADMFYIVQSGTLCVDVVSCAETKERKEVMQYKAQDSFGELALMYNKPRAATVTVTSEACALLCLCRTTFRLVLQSTTSANYSYLEQRLRKIPLLQSLSLAQVRRLVDAVETRTFSAGDVIIERGATADALFLLLDGSAAASASDLPSTALRNYISGDFFGEMGLLRAAPRAATVRATSALCTVGVVEADAVTRLLGPCQDVLSGRAESILAPAPHASAPLQA